MKTNPFAVLALLAVAAASAAQDPTRPLAAEPTTAAARAKAALEHGDYRGAETTYLLMLRIATTSSARAEALFGRAFAMQQRILTGDTIDATAAIDSAVNAYGAALELDATTWRTAVHNNRGLLLAAAGRHDAALADLRQATLSAGDSDPARATYLVNLAREFEVANMLDSAQRTYTAALRVDRRRADAVRGLLALLVRANPAFEVIAEADRRSQDTATASAVVTALASLLTRRSPTVTDADARDALRSMAQAIPVARIAPASFAVSLAPRVRASEAVHPELRREIRAFLDVMTPRSRGEPIPDAFGADSWTNGNHFAVWSSLLRWVGDCYNEAGEFTLARRFYESATVDKYGDLRRSIDRRALLPLAIIYTRSPEDASKLSHLTESLFGAKALAYEANDLPQIRDFHMTLGALYAARGQWDGPNARNAEFQIEHLRAATKALERTTGRAVSDPPELLEELAIRYRVTGRKVRSDSIKAQVRADLIKQGRTAEADAAVARIDRGVLRPPGGRSSSMSDPGQTKAQLKPITIAGVVRSANGPVAGARVAIGMAGSELTAVTAKDGTFTVTIPGGTTEIEVKVSALNFKSFDRRMKTAERISVLLDPPK